MTDETNEVRAVLSTGKTIKLGNEKWRVTRDNATVEIVDLICEARVFNGIVSLSFAQTIMDAGDEPEAHICSRIRMNLATAQALHGILENVISDALKPADKSKAN